MYIYVLFKYIITLMSCLLFLTYWLCVWVRRRGEEKGRGRASLRQIIATITELSELLAVHSAVQSGGCNVRVPQWLQELQEGGMTVQKRRIIG